ncbi:hypothetical protein [Mycobacteroides franklinii]|nr:hypothetical protein [Mycobacteroides franklinii]
MRSTTISAGLRAVPVTVHDTRSWTVVDDSGLPLGEIGQFLR